VGTQRPLEVYLDASTLKGVPRISRDAADKTRVKKPASFSGEKIDMAPVAAAAGVFSFWAMSSRGGFRARRVLARAVAPAGIPCYDF
jgi:hypothetical protein